jgi:hypothetical protein
MIVAVTLDVERPKTDGVYRVANGQVPVSSRLPGSEVCGPTGIQT